MRLSPEPRTRGDGRMAELVPFAGSTGSDKTLLVWELSSGPTAEGLASEPGRGGGGWRKSPRALVIGSPGALLQHLAACGLR